MYNSWLENRIHKWHYDHLEGGDMGRFTTAEISITNVDSALHEFHGAFFSEGTSEIPPATFGKFEIPAGTLTVNIILLDGSAFLETDIAMDSLTLTGNITYNSELGALIVTGDGTISNLD